MLVTLGIIVTLVGMALTLWVDRHLGDHVALQSLGAGCFVAGLAMLTITALPII